MANADGKLRLGAFLMSTGHHVAAWRHPDSVADAGVNFAHVKSLVQAAEAAKFDLVFVADSDDLQSMKQFTVRELLPSPFVFVP